MWPHGLKWGLTAIGVCVYEGCVLPFCVLSQCVMHYAFQILLPVAAVAVLSAAFSVLMLSQVEALLNGSNSQSS